MRKPSPSTMPCRGGAPPWAMLRCADWYELLEEQNRQLGAHHTSYHGMVFRGSHYQGLSPG